MLTLLAAALLAASPSPVVSPPSEAREVAGASVGGDEAPSARADPALERSLPSLGETFREKRTPPPLPLFSPPQGPLSDRRAGRFLGALLGGAVGLAAPMLLLPVADQACPATFGFRLSFCFSHLVVGAGGLVLSLLGAALGVSLAGGEVSGAALAAGSFVGLLLSLALAATVGSVALAAQVPGGGVSGLALPVVISGGALVVAAQALAALFRSDALEARPWVGASAGRLALTSVAFLGTLGGGLLLATLLVSSGGYVGGLLGLGLGVGSIGVSPLVAWAAHRASGGRGSLGVSYLATVGIAGLGVLGALLAALTANASIRGNDWSQVNGGAAAALVVGGAILGGLGLPLALEASHVSVLTEERAQKVTVSLAGAPVPGGAMGLVTARF